MGVMCITYAMNEWGFIGQDISWGLESSPRHGGHKF